MFLLQKSRNGKPIAKIEVTSVERHVMPSEGSPVCAVRLSCRYPDGCDELDLHYGSMKEMLHMYDGIRLIVGSNAIYGSIAELEAAALSALEGVSP